MNTRKLFICVVMTLLLVVLGIECLAGDKFRDSLDVPPQKSLFSDPWLNAYLTNGCVLVYTVKASNHISILDGPFDIADSNGVRVVSGSYRDGKWHGELVLWHTNAVMASKQYYSNGRNQGVETYWNDQGIRLRTTEYSDGEKHGIEIYWAPGGNVVSRVQWEHGQPLQVELFELGNLKRTLVGAEAAKYFRDKALLLEQNKGVTP